MRICLLFESLSAERCARVIIWVALIVQSPSRLLGGTESCFPPPSWTVAVCVQMSAFKYKSVLFIQHQITAANPVKALSHAAGSVHVYITDSQTSNINILNVSLRRDAGKADLNCEGRRSAWTICSAHTLEVSCNSSTNKVSGYEHGFNLMTKQLPL